MQVKCLTMAEGNGEILAKNEETDKTEDYPKLIKFGLDEKVALKLDEIYKSGKLSHAELDDRALDALKEFPIDGAINVLNQFLESNLEHVSNKSAYLCGVMKTVRQKSRSGNGGSITNPVKRDVSGGGDTASGPTVGSSTSASVSQIVKGPDEEKIKAILVRTGYALDVTTGQRKYGGPPPGWEGAPPGSGCEVFCGKIPKDIFEDELIVLFEKSGKIWDLRLMMDPMTNTNRGYAFVTYTSKEEALQAVKDLDNYEIKPNKHLKINISVPNLRLFVGNIPKSKGKDEILEEFGKLAAGLTEVIIYSSPDDKKKNRGFCFLEYESHKAASLAKRRLGTGRIKVWGCDIIVDWADPQEEPDEGTMATVKVLYVRNLTQDCTEEKLRETFEEHGKIDRVKKIKDYAFIHFDDREQAVAAMKSLNGKEVAGSIVEVSLAKPPSDKKKKEEILRARERRMMQMIQIRGNGGYSPQHPTLLSGGPRTSRNLPSSSSGTLRSMGRGDYDYDYDYYGYGDYRGGYNDPYYDDYYRYEDYYYEYAPPAPSGPTRNRPRQPPQPAIMEAGAMERGLAITGMNSGTQVGRGRRGAPQQVGGVQVAAAGQDLGARRQQRLDATGTAHHLSGLRTGYIQNHLGVKQSLQGKRKMEVSTQNQRDSKRRFDQTQPQYHHSYQHHQYPPESYYTQQDNWFLNNSSDNSVYHRSIVNNMNMSNINSGYSNNSSTSVGGYDFNHDLWSYSNRRDLTSSDSQWYSDTYWG